MKQKENSFRLLMTSLSLFIIAIMLVIGSKSEVKSKIDINKNEVIISTDKQVLMGTIKGNINVIYYDDVLNFAYGLSYDVSMKEFMEKAYFDPEIVIESSENVLILDNSDMILMGVGISNIDTYFTVELPKGNSNSKNIDLIIEAFRNK